MREFQELERSFTELAGDTQWMTDNHDKMLHAQGDATAPLASTFAGAQSISQQ